ncbi:MAG: hypothetical protein FJ149_00150 [Euryarchaeota archaeon]|nr:hypothetical protein [Euryarchaeota archaeon]
MKSTCLPALIIIGLAMSAVPAPAETFVNEVHKTVHVSGYHYFTDIKVGAGQMVEYKVKVNDGDEVCVNLIANSSLNSFFGGSSVTTYCSNKDVREAGNSHREAGNYALVIDNYPGYSTCKVDISVRGAGFQFTDPGCCTVGVIVGILLGVSGALFYRGMRTRPMTMQPPIQPRPLQAQPPPPPPQRPPPGH